MIPKPVVSVITKEKFTYTEPIEKPVIYKEDNTQYKTYLKVEQHGEEGEKKSPLIVQLTVMKKARNHIRKGDQRT